MQLEVRATDYNRFQDKMNKGSVQIFFWGWLADYPDAENFLFMLYGPNAKALTDGNGENNANYQNPEFDKLYEQMKFLDDGPEKQKLIDQMIEIVQKDAVWSFGYFPDVGGGLSPVDQQRQADADHPQPHRLPAARSRTARPQDRRMEPAGVVADSAARARVARRHRAGVVRLAPA